VTGQGVIGRECAWCALPAVGEIEVQPAEQRTVTRVDPVTGERTSYQRTVRAAVVVAVCDDHAQIKAGQPRAVAVPRQRVARDVQQLGLFVTDEDARLRNAIYRETQR